MGVCVSSVVQMSMCKMYAVRMRVIIVLPRGAVVVGCWDCAYSGWLCMRRAPHSCPRITGSGESIVLGAGAGCLVWCRSYRASAVCEILHCVDMDGMNCVSRRLV